MASYLGKIKGFILKEYYRLEEASKYLSKKLEEDFTMFDLLLTATKNKIRLSMYHSGFIGVASFSKDFISSERVVRRIPFDGIVDIISLGYIQEVSESSEFTVSEIVPKHWIRHENKQIRIIEELSKIQEPMIFMVDHINVIYSKTLSINKLLISQQNLVSIMAYLKGLTDETTAPPPVEKKCSLSITERETLLIIIAALAKEAKIDITKKSKAGELIESLTQQIGSRVGATTIETHLKKISHALENRAK